MHSCIIRDKAKFIKCCINKNSIIDNKSNKRSSILPISKISNMKTIYLYHCFYYTEDDEYEFINNYDHEMVFFNNSKDAEEYKNDFESDSYRLDVCYTNYSGRIITIDEKVVL